MNSAYVLLVRLPLNCVLLPDVEKPESRRVSGGPTDMGTGKWFVAMPLVGLVAAWLLWIAFHFLSWLAWWPMEDD